MDYFGLILIVDFLCFISLLGFKARSEIPDTMVFKEGSKVEVWNRREVPSGSWWTAEIVSFNGDMYSVRYDGNSESSCTVMEIVPRKAIRPCPPLMRGLRHLMTGDVVEVFENNSWKLAEVLEVVDRSYCDVRLLGSYRFRAHKSHIRMRMSWQGNRWVVIRKVIYCDFIVN